MASVSNQSSIFPKSNYDIDQCIIGCLNNNESAQVAKASQAGMAAVRGHRQEVVKTFNQNISPDKVLAEKDPATLGNVAKVMHNHGLMTGSQIGEATASGLLNDFQDADECLKKYQALTLDQRTSESWNLWAKKDDRNLIILLKSGPIYSMQIKNLIGLALQRNVDLALLISELGSSPNGRENNCGVFVKYAVANNNKQLLQRALASARIDERTALFHINTAIRLGHRELVDVLEPFA